MLRSSFLISIFLFALAITGETQGSELQMPAVLTIKINEAKDKFLKQAPSAIKVTNRPPGVNFFSLDWKAPELGTVNVDHGSQSIQIAYARALQAEDDPSFPDENITEWNVYSGVSESEFISHDDARRKIYALLNAISAKGWKSVIDRDDPRLTGKERFNYVIQISPSSSLNPHYEPTLDEWMKLEDMSHWSFYADHAFLTVSMRRSQERLDVTKPGSYLLIFNLKGENEGFRSFVSPKARKNWRSELSPMLKRLKEQRTLRETQAQAGGKKIDTNYEDPPSPIP